MYVCSHTKTISYNLRILWNIYVDWVVAIIHI